jgi:ABC-type transport system involved in multi-copper enzyme maturation permease subunit
MMSAVFRKAFRDSRRGTMWLAVGLGLYMVFVLSFFPTIVDESEQFDELLKSYPKELMSLFYGGTVEDISLSDPATFLQTYFSSYTVLLLGAVVIAQAFNAVTNAERDQTLDVMLSLPVSRRVYLVARMANTVSTVLIVLTVLWLVLWGGSFFVSEFDLAAGELALGIYGTLLPLLVIAGFAYLLAALVPSSKHFAGAVAYLFMMGSYLIYSFSNTVDQLAGYRAVFLFHYYDMRALLHGSVNWGDWFTLGAVALVYFGIAWWRIDRKELGV